MEDRGQGIKEIHEAEGSSGSGEFGGPWERAGDFQAVGQCSQQATKHRPDQEKESSNTSWDNHLTKFLLGHACDIRVSFNPHNNPMSSNLTEPTG